MSRLCLSCLSSHQSSVQLRVKTSTHPPLASQPAIHHRSSIIHPASPVFNLIPRALSSPPLLFPTQPKLPINNSHLPATNTHKAPSGSLSLSHHAMAIHQTHRSSAVQSFSSPCPNSKTTQITSRHLTPRFHHSPESPEGR
ncbi:hypothetical protein DL95DRAFT_389387, partial [Leptodontidium sp. 2 PMI_412]